MEVYVDQSAELRKLAERLKLDDISKALYFPKYFQIETVRLCNARCPFCASDQWDKTHPFMSDPLFEKIVTELEPYSEWIEFVSVQRAGEPLLDKQIVQRVKQLKHAGVKRILFSTNASLLDEAKTRGLLEAGLDEIMFSIDSIDEKKYGKMRIGLDYKTVIRNIKNFFQMRDVFRPDCRIRVRGVSFYDMDKQEQREELKRWEEFWAPLRKPQDRIYMKKAHNWGNQKEWDDNIPSYEEIYHPCILPWSTMNITSMGVVALCGIDYDANIRMGDINEQSIVEVWRSEKMNSIRALHREGRRNEISYCRGCKVFDLDFSLENKLDMYIR